MRYLLAADSQISDFPVSMNTLTTAVKTVVACNCITKPQKVFFKMLVNKMFTVIDCQTCGP